MQGGYIARLAQLRADAEAGRDGFSSAPNDYAASAKHNVSGGSLYVAGQRDSQQRGAKLEQSGKSVPFRRENRERAGSSSYVNDILIDNKSSDMVLVS
jgi:hypothetical protein